MIEATLLASRENQRISAPIPTKLREVNGLAVGAKPKMTPGMQTSWNDIKL